MKKKRGKRNMLIILYDKESWKQPLLVYIPLIRT